MAARVTCIALGSLALVMPTIEAFVAPGPLVRSSRAPTRASTRGAISMENFNLPIGEDQAENVPGVILGEERYKNFVKSYNPDGLVIGGPRYPVLKRIDELKLLSLTANSGLLSRLEELGLKLSDLEKILPLVEQLGLLPLVEKNQDLILQTLAPIAIEQAPLLLPVLVATLKTPPAVFYGVAAAALAAEGAVVVSTGNVALDVIAGVPLVGLAAVSVVLGSILSSGISIPAPPKSAAAPAAGPAKAAAGGRPKIAAAPKVAVKAAAPSRPAAAKPAPAPKVGPLKPAAAKPATASIPKAVIPKAAPAKPAAAKPAPKPTAAIPKVVVKPAAPKPTAAIPKAVVKPAAPKPAAAIPKAVAKPAPPKPAPKPVAAAPKPSPVKVVAPPKPAPKPVAAAPPKVAPKPAAPAPKVVAKPAPVAAKPAAKPVTVASKAPAPAPKAPAPAAPKATKAPASGSLLSKIPRVVKK